MLNAFSRSCAFVTNQCAPFVASVRTVSASTLYDLCPKNRIYTSHKNVLHWQTASEVAGRSSRKGGLARRTITSAYSPEEARLHEKTVIPGIQEFVVQHRNVEPRICDALLGGVESLRAFSNKYVVWDPLMRVEQMVRHFGLRIRGRFDALLHIRNEGLVLIDIKTGAHIDSYIIRQLAVYVASLNSDPRYVGFPQITRAGVLLVSRDGHPAELQIYERSVLERDFEDLQISVK
ncbi:hypothetical protein QR680_006631 [Steinernema hermaphroditum]|uniref:PD-(D/E)XK endonuclease-like domain-containing protein n=1 Tax=Steinernema hermaphroditum TaxID=289476 RepID=A0AA39HY96_9BILA|nr:hypothetical protein QR680_006631 [Steinernema hermaphroditum]